MSAEAQDAQARVLFGGPHFDEVGSADVSLGCFLTDLWISTVIRHAEGKRRGDLAAAC